MTRIRAARALAGAAVAGACLCGSVASAQEGLAEAQNWAGKYFTDEVNGRTFFEVPAIRAVVADRMRAGEMRRLEQGDVVTAPVAAGDGLVVVWACEPHNCGPHNWAVVIDVRAGAVYTCVYREGVDGAVSRTEWAGPFPPELAGTRSPLPEGCPSDIAPALEALRAAGF